jgi:hypothetical protein
MTNQIKMPEAVLQAKDTYHLIKTKNKALIAFLECLLFVGVFYCGAIAHGMGAGMLAAFISGFSAAAGNKMTFMEVAQKEWFTPIELTVRVLYTVIATLIAVFYQKRKLITLGYTKKGCVKQYLIGIVAGLAIFSAAVGIAAVTGSASVSINREALNVPLFLALIVGWFFQGMSEEVVCRSFTLVSMSRKLPVSVAVILNSLAFASIHLGNHGLTALALVNLTLFGIFASVVFLRTGNIWLVSAIHSVWNFAQGNIYGIAVSGGFSGPHLMNTAFNAGKTLINGGDFGLEGGLAVTTVLIVGTLLVIFVPTKKKA